MELAVTEVTFEALTMPGTATLAWQVRYQASLRADYARMTLTVRP